jgi:hypothetical protein
MKTLNLILIVFVLLGLFLFTTVAFLQDETINILWISDCDPRTSTTNCNLGVVDLLNPFYAVVSEIDAALTYAIPTSEANLREYDVIVANYCTGTARHPLFTEILQRYLASGGSIIVMADNFCRLTPDFTTAQAANQFTVDYGMSFTDDDGADYNWADRIIEHPITQEVEQLYVFRHAYLEVEEPAETIITISEQPLIAVYDGDGTIVAIATTTFDWSEFARGHTSQDVDSNRFVLWRNIFLWLADQSRDKREWGAPASSEPLFCFVVTINDSTNVRTGPGTDYDILASVEHNSRMIVFGQTTGEDGFVWWQVGDGAWVRDDVVETEGVCATVPEVEL